MKYPRLVTATAMSLLSAGLILPSGASAVPGETLDEQIARKSSQLNQAAEDAEAISGQLGQADAQVAEARANLQAAESQLPSAQAELAAAEAAKTTALAADQAAAAALREAEAKVAATKADIERVKAEIEKLKASIGSFARNVYTDGGDMTELGIILNSESPADLTTRYESIAQVSRGKNRAVDELDAKKATLDALLAELEELEEQARVKKQEAAAAVEAARQAEARAAEAKARVDQLVAQRAGALEATQGERNQVAARYQEMQAAQDEIRRQISGLQSEKQRQAAAAAAAAARQSSGSSSGSVSSQGSSSGGSSPSSSSGYVWPIPGASYGGGVGPRIHPVYGYRSCHTGIDIGVASGTPIRATASGVVVSNSSGGPYGNHTIISHDDGNASMYAHMSRFGVSSGQRVSAGQVIGYVGSTGYSTGPHLHFEIHVGGRPYNPMGWFGGSRYPVSC